MKTIAEQWHGFSEMVFRKTPAGKVQRAEMEKAFYSGAWSLFCALEKISEPDVSEEQSDAFLEAWRVECIAFKNRMMAEYAERN